MKHRILLVVVAVLSSICNLSDAQVKYALPGKQSEFDLQVEAGKITGFNKISHFYVDRVSRSGNTFIKLSVPGTVIAVEEGMPALPVFSKLVEADTANDYKLIITLMDSVVIDIGDTFSAEWIMPVQPPVRKNASSEPDTIFEISTAYLHSGKEHHSIVTICNEGFIRGVPVARVEIAPFRYDPMHQELVIYHKVAFSMDPQLSPDARSDLRSHLFRRSMSGVVMDKDPGELKRIVQDEPVTMVILSDTTFSEALQPLIEWKRLKGFNVVEAYTSDEHVGNTAASIREYMSGLYHDPPEGMAPPSYLLIAGDVEHVPVSQSNGEITDLYYTTFDGPGDYLPEIFHGRISVKNDTQLVQVIDKILMYEKYEFPDPAFLGRSILIAGYDGSWAPIHGNGQINYASGYYFNESNGIDAQVYLHPQAATQDAEIREAISMGAAMVNYTGHGDYYSWLDPYLGMAHLPEMNNQYKFGLMIGNGCKTNRFSLDDADCFAEAILKLENRGAIGYIGCTNDSYWDEDYYWSVGVGPFTSDPEYESTTFGYYDKVFHMGNEAVGDWSPSLGEMIFAGNMTVQQSASPRKKYYWEIYQLMGDPSLVPWLAVPGNEEVVHPTIIPDDANHISIKASAFDYVAVSSGGQLVQAAHADRFGQVYLQIPGDQVQGELVLVVTGDKRQPYIDTILHGTTQMGYLELTGYQVSGESVTEDGMISTDESFSLDLQLLNSSNSVVQAGDLVLHCSEDFVVLTDSVVTIEPVSPGETVTLENVFRLRITGTPVDKHSFTMAIERSGVDAGNTLFIKEAVHTPLLSSGGILWDDRPYGNGNGIPEPGEQIIFSWVIQNSGSYRSDSLTIEFPGGPGSVFDDYKQLSFGTVAPDTSAIFQVISTLGAEMISMEYSGIPFLAGDQRYFVKDTLAIVVGHHLEDFSTGDLSRFHWLNGPVEWVTDAITYSGGPYSMRSGAISHSQSTSLKIIVNLDHPDTITFKYRVSSESGYDYLKFFVDDVMTESWSGFSNWEQVLFPLDTGTHLLEWRYDKDSNTTRGDDAAWIDDVVFPSGTFTGRDLGVLQPLHPQNSRSLGSEEPLRVSLINNGRDTINGFSFSYQLMDGSWSSVPSAQRILPGEVVEINMPSALDLSDFDTYMLSVAVNAGGDEYPGNDSLQWNATHYMFPDIAVRQKGLDSVSSEYVNLALEIENMGNISAEKLYYSLYLDDDVKRDSVDVMLSPGSTGEISVSLIDASMEINRGWHEYLFLADPDSVQENNRVEGSVYWNILSLAEDQASKFRIFPNPVQSNFTIHIPGTIPKAMHISFYDMNGRLVYRDVFKGSEQVFRATDIFDRDGLYVIRIFARGRKKFFSGMIRVERIPGP